MVGIVESWRRLGFILGSLALLVICALASYGEASAQTRDGRWFGRGERDICGNPWAAEFELKGTALKGRFWRSGVLYDVYGRVDSNGRIDMIRTGKNKREFGVLGPRTLDFDLTFDAASGRAEGIYAIVVSQGALSCETPILLQRSIDQ